MLKNEMTRNIYINVGIGKTATTSLQTLICPKINKYTNLSYFLQNKELRKELQKHKQRMVLGRNIEKIKIPHNTFISKED